MLQRRRVIMLALLGLVAGLGLLLFTSVRPSTMLSIAAPVPKPSRHLPAGISPTLSGPLGSVSGTTLLEKPRYTGQDSLGRNWTLQAENALQGGSAISGTYILQQVTAEWQTPDDPAPLTLSADQGDYNQTGATILLSGNVQASGRGLTLTAPRMQADLTTRNITASGGSHVTGNVGKPNEGWLVDIRSPDISADPSRSILLFTGGVRAKLTPQSK